MPELMPISSDGHIYEPPDLWTSRMDLAWRDRAPRVIAGADGDWWFCEGRKLRASPASASQAGRRFDAPGKLAREARVSEVRQGAFDPGERIKDMELDGLDGEVVYPTVGLALYAGVPDSPLLSAIFRTYNDWIAGYCRAYPKKLRGIGMINTDDIPDAVAELRRCSRMGLAGAMVPVVAPMERPYDSPDYGPIWATAADQGLTISMHIATNRPGPNGGPVFGRTSTAPYLPNADYWFRVSAASMIFSGVFERHPGLMLGSVEHELSWAPFFLERIDYTYTQRVRSLTPYRFKGNALPSDFFRRNVFLSFQEDALGVRDRKIIGVDSLVWGSDYPHAETTFPKSREFIARIFKDVPQEETAKIIRGNAARLFRFD